MSDHMRHRTILLAGVHPLIAEDTRLHAQGTHESEEYEVITVNADECSLLPTVDRLKPDFVVLDLLHASSLRTIRRITSIIPSCRVMALTGVRHPDISASAFSSGASGILHRSDVSSELFDAVRTVGSGRRFVSSALSAKVSDRKNEANTRRTTSLSPLDELVLRLTLRGYPTSQIARALGLSARTVRLSVAFLKRFYGMRTKQELKDYASAIFCRSQ